MLEHLFLIHPYKDTIERKYGINVHVTDSPKEALEEINTDKYRLVIVDPMEFYQDPRKENLILPALRKAKSKGIPVMVSSTQSKEDLVKFVGIKEEHFDSYFDKIGKVNDYYDVVEKALGIE